MTASKAIEILTINNHHNDTFTDPDLQDAIKLGIQALRTINHLHGIATRHPHALISISSILKSDLQLELYSDHA